MSSPALQPVFDSEPRMGYRYDITAQYQGGQHDDYHMAVHFGEQDPATTFDDHLNGFYEFGTGPDFCTTGLAAIWRPAALLGATSICSGTHRMRYNPRLHVSGHVITEVTSEDAVNRVALELSQIRASSINPEVTTRVTLIGKQTLDCFSEALRTKRDRVTENLVDFVKLPSLYQAFTVDS